MNTQQLDDLLNRAATNTLRDEDTELMQNIFESYTRFFEIVRDKNSSIARLRKMMFGASSEKTDKVVGETEESTDPTDSDDASGEPPDGNGDADSDKPPSRPPGHGRRGADEYAGGRRLEVPHPTLAAGDACPECDQGTLYQKKPGLLVRFVGQAPLQATVYRVLSAAVPESLTGAC